MDGFTRLIEQKYFVVDRFELEEANEIAVPFDGPGCLVGLAGSGVVITVDGDIELIPGRTVVVPEGSVGVVVETGSGVSFVRCVAP
jgi:mannose-6-phosphate isomerase